MTTTSSTERGDRRHPDAALLARVRRALDWWAEQPSETPTSSITGGGVIGAVESAVSRLVMDRPTLALPGATYGLRVALLTVGVRPDDDVLVSALDWPAGRAAVTSIGANPVAVDVDPTTLTMDPVRAASARTGRTRALLATHLHGVCADVPALRAVLGDSLPIIEDAAQAFGASLDKHLAGTLGDVAVLSFGPGKVIDVGELAVLVARDEAVLAEAVRRSQHPVRQRLCGVTNPDLAGLTGRAAPLSALLAMYELRLWPSRLEELRRADSNVHRILNAEFASEIIWLAAAPRRLGQPGVAPVLVPGRGSFAGPCTAISDLAVSISCATPFVGSPYKVRRYLTTLAERVRLLSSTANPACRPASGPCPLPSREDTA